MARYGQEFKDRAVARSLPRKAQQWRWLPVKWALVQEPLSVGEMTCCPCPPEGGL